MHKWTVFAIALLLAGCSDSPAPVQEDDGFEAVDPEDGLGAITGVVVSPTIVPIAGANITILTTTLSTSSNEAGAFTFSDLEPGVYILQISAPGYEPVQATADVREDATTKVKVVLPVDTSPQPFHDTLSHQGFIQASPGIAGFVIEVLLNGTVDLCDCSFEFDHEPSVKTYVYEAFYDETLVSPVPHRGYYWELWMQEPEVEGQTGYGHSPINVHLDAGFYAGATTMEARLTGPDEWVSYQQDFEMHITRFHIEPAPEGWSIQG